MKSRRLSSVIRILIVASVFLLSLASCGIPTYLVPKTSISTSSLPGSDIEFTLKYESENSGSANSDRIGLVLFYYVESGSYNTQKSYINNWFTSNAKISTYDGASLSIEHDDALTTIKGSNDQSFDLFAFQEQGRAIYAPYYNLPIDDTSGPITYRIKLHYDSSNNTVEVSEISTPSQFSSFIMYLDDDVKLLANDYLCIYGAISVQSNNYSNLYWSDLNYIGSLQAE